MYIFLQSLTTGAETLMVTLKYENQWIEAPSSEKIMSKRKAK